MGNLLAVGTHCAPGEEAILGHRQHIYVYEGGGASALFGAVFQTVPNADDGTFSLEEAAKLVKPDDFHFPISRLLALENTHNACGGRVLTPDFVDEAGAMCAEQGLRLHVDGARLMSASVASGHSVARLLAAADTACICLSKGLGCPAGSVLVGGEEFIATARRRRKMLGGGMRQTGLLAACGHYALDHNVERLAEDHAAARALAEGLDAVEGVEALGTVETNIAFFTVHGGPLNLVERLDAEGVKLLDFEWMGVPAFRAVTHLDTHGVAGAAEAVATIREVLGR